MSLLKIRELLKELKIDVYVLPRTDEHQSEELCKEDQRVAFLTGFTGSNGIAFVSETEAYVWTDGRYFIQAEKQLKQGWKLRKQQSMELQWFDVVTKTYPKGTVVGIDGRLISSMQGEYYHNILGEHQMILKVMDKNIVDDIWTDRCGSSACQIYVHQNWAGTPALQKIKFIQNAISFNQGQGALFGDLSAICWILNIRSNQIPCMPCMKGYLFIQPQNQKQHILYLPAHHPHHVSCSEQIQTHLKNINVKVNSYPWAPFPQKVLIQKYYLNYLIFSQLKNPIFWDEGISMIRAIRNQKQREGFRQAHIRDGVAQARFWSWRSKQQKVGQYEAAMYLDSLRQQEQNSMGISFPTIYAGGANGAIIHYTPQKQNDYITDNNMVLLVDSGGQYLDGTTDVTRCFHFGQPTQQEKESFTQVLIANLDVEMTTWPEEIQMNGGMLDKIARSKLLAANKQYFHGTGHGVGYFLGVHQAPVAISTSFNDSFQPGMIVSNQPGYYEQNKYGIRIENMLLCIKQNKTLSFQNLTLCPYDINLINKSLLQQKYINFINNYHQKVLKILQPCLSKYPDALQWLISSTRPI